MNRIRMNQLVAFGLLLGAAGATLPLQAQTVWRCGADGRSFSDRPCADGQRVEMTALADERSASEVLAAREVAARQQRLAEALRQERLQREASPPAHMHALASSRHGGESVNPRRGTKTQAKREPTTRQRQPGRQPPAADGIWRAVAPASPRTKD
jgi:hypothetical protein